MRRISPIKLLMAVLLTAMICAACAAFTACDPAPDPSEVTTEQDTVPENPTEKETDMNESATEPVTEAETELFKPDPDRAVPQYDALLSDLDSFPITFKYDDTTYAGFEGFALESEAYESVDRGTQSTLILRHPEIPAAFKLVARVFPQESAYEYVVYITNDGKENTENFRHLYFEVEFEGGDAKISGIKGDAGGQNYTPYEHDLTERNRYSDVCTSGRPSHGVFPYYNLSYGDGGTFIAIG